MKNSLFFIRLISPRRGQGPNLLVHWVNTTIKQRRRSLDVDLWKQRPFVIEDPSDPDEILYLRESEFHQYQRVSLSNGINLTIIARDTTPQTEIGPIPSDDNSNKADGTPSSSNSTTSSSHLKKSPPLLGLIGTFFECGKDSLVDLNRDNAVRLCFKYIVKLYYWSYGTKSAHRHRVALEFSRNLLKILEHQGPMGVILRLKVSLIAINAYVGGNPLKTTFELGTYVALTNGLPKWIPREARSQIRRSDLNVIRIWVSVCNIYKALRGTWKTPSLKDVMAEPIPETQFLELGAFAKVFWDTQKWVPRSLLFDVKGYVARLMSGTIPYFISVKSGPNGAPGYRPGPVLLDSIAWIGYNKGPFYWVKEMSVLLGLDYLIGDMDRVMEDIRSKLPIPLDHFESYLPKLYTDPEAPLNALGVKNLKAAKKFKLLREYRDLDFETFETKHSFSPYRREKNEVRLYSALSSCKTFRHTTEPSIQMALRLALIPFRVKVPVLGRLGLIQEAAGKNRIVAMNDFWTQQALRPLHRWLFAICTYLPQDSTFDQEGALARFVAREDITEYFSYDLSAATDLMPTGIYKAVLSPIVGERLADTWISLLVDKDFTVPFRATGGDGKTVKTVRYTRGQPMGALSSWGLLNVSHHILVQYSRLYSIVLDLIAKKDSSQYWDLLPKDDFVLKSMFREYNLAEPRFSEVLSNVISRLSKSSFFEGLLPFDKYVVLGDDVVIGDREVAETYYSLVSQRYQVPIKLAKSYISSTLVNFANQTYFNKTNISPIPFKELISMEGMASRFEFASRVVRRWFTETSVIRYLRVALSDHLFQRLRGALSRGEVFGPILPVLFALTLVGAPIAGWGTFEDTDEGVRDKILTAGAFAGSPEFLYKTGVSTFHLTTMWKKVLGESYVDSKEFRSYVVFLLKYFAKGYLGKLDTLDISVSAFPHPEASHNAIYCGDSRNWEPLSSPYIYVGRARHLVKCTMLSRLMVNVGYKWQTLPIMQLIGYLKIILDEPDLFATLESLDTWSKQKSPAKSLGLTDHEYMAREQVESGALPWEDPEDFRRRTKDLQLSMIMKASALYLDLGGSFKSSNTVALSAQEWDMTLYSRERGGKILTDITLPQSMVRLSERIFGP